VKEFLRGGLEKVVEKVRNENFKKRG